MPQYENSVDWAYVAGFFDGEGSVCCYEKVRADRGGAVQRQFGASFYQSSFHVLDEVAKFLVSEGIAAKVLIHHKDQSSGRIKDAWLVQVSGLRSTYMLLRKMAPFLIVKRGRVLDKLDWIDALTDNAVVEGSLDNVSGSALRRYMEVAEVRDKMPSVQREPVSWKYVAGFFDGEGSVQCYERIGKAGKQRLHRQFRATIYQNDRGVLEEIARFLGNEGIRSSLIVHQTKPNGHTSWQLQIGSVGNAYAFLTKILPCVLVKASAVEEAIRFIHRVVELVRSGDVGLMPANARRPYLELAKGMV